MFPSFQLLTDVHCHQPFLLCSFGIFPPIVKYTTRLDKFLFLFFGFSYFFTGLSNNFFLLCDGGSILLTPRRSPCYMPRSCGCFLFPHIDLFSGRNQHMLNPFWHNLRIGSIYIFTNTYALI